MTDWIPKRRPSDRVLDLDRDERFVLSRVDGRLNTRDLALLAGISPGTVEAILDRLVSRGAVQKSFPPAAPSLAPLSGVVVAERVSDEEAASLASLPELEILPDDDEPPSEEDFGDDLAVPVDTSLRARSKLPSAYTPGMSAAPAAPAPSVRPAIASKAPDTLYLASQSLANVEGDELEEVSDEEDANAQLAPEVESDVLDCGEMPELDELPAATLEEEAPADQPLDARGEEEIRALGSDASHMRIYAAQFREMTVDERVALVSRSGTMGPPEAMALDPDPHVIRALFENPGSTLKHGRLAALHHRNAIGLDALARRADILRDSQVQRLLLRNPMTSEALARRILQPRRLVEIYKSTLDRDIPDRIRAGARNVLRRNFTRAPSEDRFALIWTTEARVLQTLVGCTLDSRTTATICGKPVTSVMLVQNFARWGATPPAVLAHFLKANFVRRHPPLKKMLLQHPNTPSDAKRGA